MAKSSSKRPRVSELRASEREGITLDCSALTFRDLMTEQSKVGEKWTTYYLGTRSEFAAIGLPDEAFPNDERERRFDINGQPARMARKGSAFELALSWPDRSPWVHSAGHPATTEIERMIRRSVSYWIGYLDDDELPTSHLVESEEAVDYRLPASKRFKLARGQKASIHQLAEYLYQIIHNSEVMPVPAAPTTKPTKRGNVVDISDSKKLKARCLPLRLKVR